MRKLLFLFFALFYGVCAIAQTPCATESDSVYLRASGIGKGPNQESAWFRAISQAKFNLITLCAEAVTTDSSEDEVILKKNNITLENVDVICEKTDWFGDVYVMYVAIEVRRDKIINVNERKDNEE